MHSGAQIIFPENGRGLGHVTPTIFGSTVGYPSDSLASCKICLFSNCALDPEIDRVDRLSWSFEGGVESSWEKGLKSSRPIESIVWQLSWVEVTEVDLFDVILIEFNTDEMDKTSVID